MQVVHLFVAVKGTTFIQLWQVTANITGMKKTKDNDGVKRFNRFAGEVEKLNCLNGVTNYNYENMINNARDKEALADFRNDLEPKMIKAGIPQDKIDLFFKGVKSDVTDNVEDFKAGKNNVGTYVDDSKCIMENTPDEKGSSQWAGVHGYYIQMAIIHYAKPVYRWIKTSVELTADEVIEMKKFITPKKAEGANQGLEKPYVIRSPRFETITAVTLKGTNYRLRD
jgi:hypothetical protein